MNAALPAGPQVLGPVEAREYWDRRHAEGKSLASGGHASWDEATNAMLYDVRKARIIAALDEVNDAYRPLRVLDAGCGKGHFSRALAGYGHRVDGIDASPAAVALCQESGGSRESYAVSTLASWRPAYLYDAAICVDVLFHLMDDADWLDSVRNLASLVRLGGSLVLADHDSDEDRVWSAYQKTRARSRYNEVLAEAGFEVAAFIRNDFRTDPVGMYVARRVS